METLWQKLLWWKKPKMLREGVDFRFVNLEDSDITAIGILQGEFKDILYHYHKVRISEQGEIASLEFGYTILYSGNHNSEDLQNNQDFVNLMGEILSQILENKVDNEQIRTDHSEELSP